MRAGGDPGRRVAGGRGHYPGNGGRLACGTRAVRSGIRGGEAETQAGEAGDALACPEAEMLDELDAIEQELGLNV